jgi:uncharacterized membrane protein YqjE
MPQSDGDPAVDPGAEPAGRLLGSVRGLVASLLAIGRTRLELLTVEVQLEIRRVADLLVLALAAVVAAGAGLVMAGLALVLAFWDAHRLLVAVLVTASFLGIAGVAALMARRRLNAASGFLAGTLGELARDAEQLRRGD